MRGHTRGSVLALAGALLAPLAGAQVSDERSSPVAERGFSYFMGLGQQFVQYHESASSVAAASSSVSTRSPVLVTGGLYAIDERWLFALNSDTSFAAGRGTEAWRSAAAVFNGVTLTDPVLQRNGFSLSTSRLQALGQYRVQGPWFASGGLAMRSLSFKRFSFVQGTDKAVALPSARTVEESVSEVLAEAGFGVESERVRGAAEHYGARLSLATPVWRRLENTNVPDLQFNQARGLDLALEGRWSRQVYPHVHLGLWGQWTLSQRAAQTLGSAEMPRSRLSVMNLGLELLWKL